MESITRPKLKTWEIIDLKLSKRNNSSVLVHASKFFHFTIYNLKMELHRYAYVLTCVYVFFLQFVKHFQNFKSKVIFY